MRSADEQGQSVSGQPSVALSTPARLRELLSAATAGPWRLRPGDFRPDEASVWSNGPPFKLCDWLTNPNAALIVAMHDALPALLDCVDALERIALGISGRMDSGLLLNEGGGFGLPNQPKTDWQLAQDALAALDNKEPRPSGDHPESPTAETEETL